MDDENIFVNTWVDNIPPVDLRRIRITAGLSQQEFADKYGLADRTEVSHIESGRRTITLPIMRRYAKALGVEVVISFSKLYDPTHPRATNEHKDMGAK